MRLENDAMLSGRYKIVRYISSGGFANTYEAIDTRLEKRVAIKELFIDGVCNRADEDGTVAVGVVTNEPMFKAQKDKFKKEALRLSGCSHPNIVRVYDVFEENNTIYYAMDFIEGKSLVTFNRPMPEAKVQKYLMQILDALEYIHLRSILHLDLKPANIMIDGNDNVVLIDFGASKIVDENGDFKSTTSQMAYTPGYAPLEQTSGASKVGPYSDIYALGATLFNLFTGKTPPMIDEILGNKDVLRINGISTQMQTVIYRAMEVSSANRLQNVAEIKVLLAATNENESKTLIDSTLPPMVRQKNTAIGSELKLNANPVSPRMASENKNKVKTKSENNKYLLWIIILLGVIAVLGIIFLIKGTSGEDQKISPKEPIVAQIDSTSVDSVIMIPQEKEPSKTETEVATVEEKPAPPKALTVKYYGTLGPYHVNVTLKYPNGAADGDIVTGYYSYKEFKTDKLLLDGTLTGGRLILRETAKKSKVHSADWYLEGDPLRKLEGSMTTVQTGDYHSISLRRIN